MSGLTQVCDPAPYGLNAFIIEAHSIPEEFTNRITPEPRPGIAGLGTRSDGSHFDKPKAQRRHRTDEFGILVKAGGKPNARSKDHTPDLGLILRTGLKRQPYPGGEFQKRGTRPKGPAGKGMSALGIQFKEQGLEQRIEQRAYSRTHACM